MRAALLLAAAWVSVGCTAPTRSLPGPYRDLVVTGIVTDSSARPVAGGTLKATALSPSFPSNPTRVGDCSGTVVSRSSTVNTDAAGHFVTTLTEGPAPYPDECVTVEVTPPAGSALQPGSQSRLRTAFALGRYGAPDTAYFNIALHPRLPGETKSGRSRRGTRGWRRSRP